MIKHFFVLFIFMLTLQIEASVDHDHETRVAWVIEVKSFLLDLEMKNPVQLTTDTGRNFLQKLALFEEALATGNYECFFAGWPSTLVKSNGKKLCQNPAAGNSEYQSGKCGDGQLQCQPVMFGKDLCVGFSNKNEKQMAFSSCEKKFKNKGNYDYLKTMTPEEKLALKEISILANDICVTGKVGIQKSKPMCQSLMNKFKEGLTAIDRAPAVTDIEVIEQEIDEKVIEEKSIGEANNADLIPIIFTPPVKTDVICDDPLVVDQKVINSSNQLIEVANHNTNSLYDVIKKDFLGSPLCEPDKILNDPKEKLSPILFKQLSEDMHFIVKVDASLTRGFKISQFKNVAEQYNLSEETISYGEDLLKAYPETAEGRFEAMARLRGVMLQEMDKLSKKIPGYQADLIKEKLLERNIFTADPNGSPQCPFVSEDAFREALAGREAIMKTSHKNKITNPDVITIVDYSRPSYERRMFVIDIKTKKVLHYTWVAHGGGKDRSQEAGIDNLGSSPVTSNASGSLLSSEGFYVARTAGFGDKYLNNVTLEGIDVNNKSMGARALVVHGWRTPNHEYVNKTWVISDAKKRVPGVDIYKNFMATDFKTTKEDLFNLTQEVNAAASAHNRLDATDGCLGVPDTQMGHVDYKGRQKSQLELLRDDLPGTLMFNYNGEKKTKSQYLQ
jgi:hypothetical protein